MRATVLVSSFAAVVIALGSGAAVRADSAQGQVQPQAFGLGAVMPGPGVQNPTLIVKVPPKYTRDGMRAKVQGQVELDAVVKADGTVGEVRVARSLDTAFGLDQQAIEAARQWVFRPGVRNGQPVAVLVKIVLEFTMRSDQMPSAQPAQSPSAQPAQSQALNAAELQAKAQELQDLVFLSGVFRIGPGVSPPMATTMVRPKYTAEAMRRRIQGEVVVEAVVDAEGNVVRARVKQSLDNTYGLDENAVVAAKEWKFDRATIQPQASPVLVEFRLEFRLH